MKEKTKGGSLLEQKDNLNDVEEAFSADSSPRDAPAAAGIER